MAVVKVIRPELSPEEREKRMKAIKQATIQLIVATEKAKRLKSK